MNTKSTITRVEYTTLVRQNIFEILKHYQTGLSLNKPFLLYYSVNSYDSEWTNPIYLTESNPGTNLPHIIATVMKMLEFVQKRPVLGLIALSSKEVVSAPMFFLDLSILSSAPRDRQEPMPWPIFSTAAGVNEDFFGHPTLEMHRFKKENHSADVIKLAHRNTFFCRAIGRISRGKII